MPQKKNLKIDQRPKDMLLKLKKKWAKELNRHFPKNIHDEHQTRKDAQLSTEERQTEPVRDSISLTRTVSKDPVH